MKKLLVALVVLTGCPPSITSPVPGREVTWERLRGGTDNLSEISRLRTPEGWLVWAHCGCGPTMTYVPDPSHAWAPSLEANNVGH